jgi:hypothetical protein
MVQMNNMDALFDRVSPILETFGREQGEYITASCLILDPSRPEKYRLGVSLYL